MVIRSFNGNTFLRAARNFRPNFWVIESAAARVAICRHGNRHADDLHPLGERSIVPPPFLPGRPRHLALRSVHAGGYGAPRTSGANAEPPTTEINGCGDLRDAGISTTMW